MKKARRSFDQQFKIVAVRALAESGKTTGEFARALGIGRSQLERWKKRLEGRPRLLTTFPAKDGVGAEQHELAELRREVAEHKRAEVALQETLEEHRALIETTDTGYVVLNAEGRVLGANREYVRLSGHGSVEEILGHNVIEWTAPHDIQRNAEEVTRAVERGSVHNFEIEYVDRQGTATPVEINATILHTSEGLRIVTLCRDITERRRTSDERRESEEKYRATFETTGTATVLIEADTTISLANREFELLSGYSREDIEGKKSWTEFVVPQDLDRMLTQHRIRRERGEAAARRYEFGFVNRRGETRDILLTIDVIPGTKQSVASLADLTEHKRTARALQENEELYRTLVTTVPDLIVRTDLSGKVVFVNETGFPSWGYAKMDAIVGKNMLAFIAEEERERAARNAEIMFQQRLGPREYTLILEGRPNLNCEVAGNVLRDGQGRPSGMVYVVRDITERKHVQDQIVASLHEKELLLKEIHHRVKNNMQVISSLLSLESQKVDDVRVKELFRESMNRIRSMALVHEKLYRSDNIAAIDFDDYLRSVTAQLLRFYHKEGINCTVDAKNILLGVDAAIPCGLIVNELVSNTFKHAFAGRKEGSVVVGLHRRDNGLLELTVHDNGVGFPRGVDFREMRSMGMTLVKALTEQISGRIALEHTSGTRFVITFPG